jgi:hypothetical protein
MTTTPYTAAARRKAKRIIQAVCAKSIQIWECGHGFQVMTFERPGCSYGSIVFESKAEAFRHILLRATNTGHDMDRFEAIADRYARRFGIPA